MRDHVHFLDLEFARSRLILVFFGKLLSLVVLLQRLLLRVLTFRRLAIVLDRLDLNGDLLLFLGRHVHVEEVFIVVVGVIWRVAVIVVSLVLTLDIARRDQAQTRRSILWERCLLVAPLAKRGLLRTAD